jgi:hypothetical protein
LSDSLARVKNLGAFFNSTHPVITSAYAQACKAKPGNICSVSAVVSDRIYGNIENSLRQYSSEKDTPDGGVYNGGDGPQKSGTLRLSSISLIFIAVLITVIHLVI